MILDYSQTFERRGTKGSVCFKSADSNIDLFRKDNESFCPYCEHSKLESIVSHQKQDYPEWLFGSFDQYEGVVRCPTCGWWEYRYRNQSDAAVDGIIASDLRIITAQLRKFDEKDKLTPIEVLGNYIKVNPSKIYSINAHSMEALVQSVFREFYNCEVKLVGKSHDGGKDLIIVNSDTPTIVQVKRRESPGKVEPVSTVRDLLGASVLENTKSCIIVSTADHFSSDAIKAANAAVNYRNYEKFELIDCKNFIGLLDLTYKQGDTPWNQFLMLGKDDR